MQSDAEFADERGEIFLAGVRHFLEIDRDARVLMRLRVLDEQRLQMLTGAGIREHVGHRLHLPDVAVVIIEERHHWQPDVQGFQPSVELGVLVDGQTSVGGEGVELFGNQQVDIVIVKLEGSKAVGIPIDVKCRAQRIIMFGNVAESGDFAVPPQPVIGALQFRIRATRGNGTVALSALRKEQFGQVRTANDVEEKYNDNQREKDAGNFENTACAAPAAAFFVVEYGAAFHDANIPS